MEASYIRKRDGLFANLSHNKQNGVNQIVNIDDYDKKMRLALVESQGGCYFMENYKDAVKSTNNLSDVVNDIIHDYKLDLA